MSDLVRAELRKALSGRAWWILLACSVLMSGVTAYGYAELMPGTDPVAGSAAVFRAWMMVFLFAAVLGALTVAREYGSGTIARSVLLAGGRGRLFVAKGLTGTVLGLGFALVATVGGVLSLLLMPQAFGVSAAYGPEVLTTALGVAASCVLAAWWGVGLAWLIRNPIGAVAVPVVLILLVEPGLQRLIPEASGYLFSIALSSVYGDVKDGLPAPLVALGVAVLWVAAALIAAHRTVRVRDVD